jgi:hypothetical protein
MMKWQTKTYAKRKILSWELNAQWKIKSSIFCDITPCTSLKVNFDTRHYIAVRTSNPN